jgi:hypothetical protein
MNNLDKIASAEYYVNELASKIKIDNYQDWVVTFGMPLAALGEDGRPLFHKLSQTSSKYDYQENDTKFSDLIKKHNGQRNIESLFTIANKDYNIPAPKKANYTSVPQFREEPQEEEEKWLFNLNDVRNAEAEETIWAFIVKGVNNAIVASSEAGKSTLLMLLSIAITQGRETFLNWPLKAKKGRVLIVSTEDGISQLKSRLDKMLKGSDIENENQLLFIFDAHDLSNRIEKVLKENPCDLVIIDTWGDLVSGKYDAENTRKPMSNIRKVCTAHDTTPLFVHHTNKASENIPDKASIKGAGDFEQACRVVMMLTLHNDKRWLCCVKGNPFPDDHKNTCYELSFNAERQQITRTGNEMPRRDIINIIRSENLGRPGTEIDWLSILHEPLRYTPLYKKVAEITRLGEPAAKKKISSAVERGEIQKDKNGLYSI